MGRLHCKRPSPAMIVALLALFVALGGSSYAAIKVGAGNIKRGAVGSAAIADNSIRTADIRDGTVTGKDVKDGALTNADINNANLHAQTANSADTATSANSADTATSAKSADTAKSANTATSAATADLLDGLDSTAFARTACTSQSGAMKGVAAIDASPTFSGTFTTVAGYNCSGQSVEARRLSMGRYEVRFNGSPATRAVATAVVSGFFADAIGITNSAPGLFIVYVLNPSPSPGAFVDDPFTMIIP